ncbi:hypothetical protein Pint_27775 [Pistacia integerrima]|uniref:Uncharacterized protein n=3 Tax=Pistacia TaxID=55512 RepID=A0ACC1CA21_9ROSI|nr:hypothetical protein Pint_27775 [Pistacia integerrima]KAJ0080315.1 hypothetical protein Patl1_23819 [Pistacia atlantica]KAJ0112441.1 hypothetical protein Patl1_03450 [Pistacia atlantica]
MYYQILMKVKEVAGEN